MSSTHWSELYTGQLGRELQMIQPGMNRANENKSQGMQNSMNRSIPLNRAMTDLAYMSLTR